MIKIALFSLVLLVVLFSPGCASRDNAPLSAIGPEASSQPAPVNSLPSRIPGPETFKPVEEDAELGDEPLDNSWEFDVPENRGVDPEALIRYHAALDAVDIRGAVIVKDGFIIDEYYKDGYDGDTVFRMASVTKSFSGAVVGLAIEKGYLDGVNVKLPEFFPQLNEPGQEDKQEVTVEHLLTHTSGIYWNEWAGGDYFRRFSSSENWVDFVLAQRMSSAPGEVFNYTTGGSHLLGAVLQEATGMTAYEFAREYLFDPMGMDSVAWRSDPQGITDAGNGISMTARDAAKFGQLYLDGGKWKDRQIISEEWVRQSVQRQAAGSPGTGEHGYSWWLRSFGGYSGYYAMGHGGQYIIVVPELNLVAVMASRVSDTYIPQRVFMEYVIPACQ